MRKDLLVYDVPPEIREALVSDAETKNVSINEAAVTILAAHYKVKYIPTGAPFTADNGGTNLSIRGGAKLHKKIDIDRARRGGGTLRGIVLERLALHYGLEPRRSADGRAAPQPKGKPVSETQTLSTPPVSAPASPSQAAAATKQKKTEYHVLKLVPTSSGANEQWLVHARNVEAVGAAAAVRASVTEGEKSQTFVAVPSRSFQPITVTVETKTQIVLS